MCKFTGYSTYLNGSLNTTINFDYGTARILSALQDIYERHSNTFSTICRLRTADTENLQGFFVKFLQASVFFGIGESSGEIYRYIKNINGNDWVKK